MSVAKRDPLGVVILGADGKTEVAAAVARHDGHRSFAFTMAGARRGANRNCSPRK